MDFYIQRKFRLGEHTTVCVQGDNLNLTIEPEVILNKLRAARNRKIFNQPDVTDTLGEALGATFDGTRYQREAPLYGCIFASDIVRAAGSVADELSPEQIPGLVLTVLSFPHTDFKIEQTSIHK